MGTGIQTDFKIYQDGFQSGLWEKQKQVTAFNAATQNTMRMGNQASKGDYEDEAFFQNIANFDVHRDTTDNAAVADQSPDQEDFRSIKVNRRLGPIFWTKNQLKKIQMSDEAFSIGLGEQAADSTEKSMFNNAIISLDAAFRNLPATNYDATGQATPQMTIQHLSQGFQLLGDHAEEIKMLVMHSTPWGQLVRGQITGNIQDVTGGVMNGGNALTLGRPTLVTDSAALVNANSGSATTTYNTLGLTDSAIVLMDSEETTAATEEVLGLKNLGMRFQSEYAYNVEIKGFTWDTTNGGLNPDETAIAVATNWDYVKGSIKDGPGCRIVTLAG